MAINTESIEKASITFCFEQQSRLHDPSGEGKTPVRQLPWCFVRFNDPGEGRDYVMPLPPGAISVGNGIYTDELKDITISEIASMTFPYGRGFIEYMTNSPFPFGEQEQVHFFGPL